MWVRVVVWVSRIRDALTRRQLERDRDVELQGHLDLLTAENIRRGMAPREARRMAHLQFGGVTPLQETLREHSGWPWLEAIAHDVKDAVRNLRRRRAFAASAVVILALGIAATTAVFSVAETLLLRPLPYPEGDRLVTLRSVSPVGGDASTRVAPHVLADWQLDATSFVAVTGYRRATADVIDGGQSDRLGGLLATPEFFEVFGVPRLGRGFRDEDRGARRPFEPADTGEAVVLGHEAWRRLFDADERLVGGQIDLHVLNFSRTGPTRYTVVGAATAPVRFPPLEADFQLGDSHLIDAIDFWMPQFVSATEVAAPGSSDLWFDVVARLRPGVTVAQAQAEMDGIARVQAERYPDTSRGRGIRVVSLREHVAGGSRNPIVLLSIGTAMLQLIACANVATLLLARGVARRRELAVRMALGAARWRIVRQLLMETFVLAACAGLLGTVLASWMINLARPWLPQSVPLLQEIGINWSVLVFALASVVVTTGMTGLAPALRAAQDDGTRVAGLPARGGSPPRLVRALVSAEVTLTIVLLIGSGLLVRSAVRVGEVETGFNPDNLLTMVISLPANKFDWDQNAVFAREAIDAVRSLPSIRDAAVGLGLPVRALNTVSTVGSIEGYVPTSDTEELTANTRVVSPGYFATMQIPILAGRSFDARDEEGRRGFPRSIVVSDSFAKRYWPGRDPLGWRVSFGQDFRAGATVVGVVGDVRYSGLETEPTVDLYLPQGLFPQAAVSLVARTRTEGNPLSEAAVVRERVRTVDPHAFVTDIRSMEQLIAGSQAVRRAGTLLVSVFGAVALALVVAGVASVITQTVAQRRLELAIRSALGAGPRRVVAVAMRTGLEPAAVGLACGTVGALGLTRAMTSVLFGVSASDVVTWAGAGAVLLAACVVSAYLPARRAGRIDPMTALRAE